jgi:hypothetical protein
LRAAHLFLLFALITPLATRAQSTLDSNRAKASIDTTLSNTPHGTGLWRRPQVARNGSDLYFTNEALRYYGSPTTIPNLFEESGGPFPLLLSDEGYGRESFLVTGRTSEGPSSSLIEGVLSTNSLLNGVALANYFPLDPFSDLRFNSGAEGVVKSGADYAASDMLDATIERFRAPVPYSRIHYTQDLARSNSNFDGLFSLNATRATNLAFGLHRHASGHPRDPFEVTFNPRTDMWGARTQMTITKYLGTLPTDSTMTQRKVDSILATPQAKRNTLDLLVWGQYNTAFSGLSGGIAAIDTTDIFDENRASVFDINTFDHRVRGDALIELQLPLLAEARTKIAGYYSYESRRILSRVDSVFPMFVPNVAQATKMGATLDQPIALSFGDFLTRANIRGDAQRLTRDSLLPSSLAGGATSITETRLSATFSDSLALKTAFRVALFGFLRTVESNLSVGGSTLNSEILPSVGLSGSIGFTDAISLAVSYNYAKDRASLSPTPSATYQLRNIGAWFDARFAFSKNDSIAIHAGVLDRHEPEGVVYDLATDTAYPLPRFSSEDLHTQSGTLALDAYFGKFHFGSSVTYFPATTPISPYTLYPALASDLPERFFGFAGLYYENEIQEGNLRLVVGPRVRMLNQLDPQLSYDRASDYYAYRGAAYRVLDSAVQRIPSSALPSHAYMLDVLLSAEVDRRAQISMSFLNILSASYYNVAIYPRDGFHWRLDVSWAFLD